MLLQDITMTTKEETPGIIFSEGRIVQLFKMEALHHLP